MTQKEQDCLKAIGDNALNNMGGDQYSDLFFDNFSWFDLNDLIRLMTDYTAHQISGLMSSLNEKGMISSSGEDWFLDEKGITYLVELI